jgi:3-polyprenyl-4-hydroxybenzoate decarboxylase
LFGWTIGLKLLWEKRVSLLLLRKKKNGCCKRVVVVITEKEKNGCCKRVVVVIIEKEKKKKRVIVVV